MTGYQSKKAAALDEDGMYLVHHTQPAKDSMAFAVIEMQIGDARIRRFITQTALENATDPWLLMELNAATCIRALKEKNNG